MKKSGKMSTAQKSSLSRRMAERRKQLTAPSASAKAKPFFRPLPPEELEAANPFFQGRATK